MPFSRYTTDVIWTDPHIAGQMLRNHLDSETDHASRRAQTIDQIVAWIDGKIGLSDKSVCDLGCGPGLYATRMAERGARVTGVDFSTSSIAYAQSSAAAQGLAIEYKQADYLTGELPIDQDIVSLIYCDLCTFSAEQRRALFARIKAMLKPGGIFVFDVFTAPQFAALHESATYAQRLMDGFWSPNDYFGFRNTFLYTEEKISLDRYLIVEPERRFEIFNWLQYFDTETISSEVREAGFEVQEILDVTTGEPWIPAPSELAIVARASV
ncbi:MAG: class I SAM-dependent methyltransferase [Phyllobacterium sp.]